MRDGVWLSAWWDRCGTEAGFCLLCKVLCWWVCVRTVCRPWVKSMVPFEHTEEGQTPGEDTPSYAHCACAAIVSNMRSSRTTAESRLAAEIENASRQADQPQAEMGRWVTVTTSTRITLSGYRTGQRRAVTLTNV